MDRWLASELIKGLKGVPDLQSKVQGYVERCAREGTAPRGSAVLQMISRHFDLDRVRGSLITSQSIFQVHLHGHPTSDLQEFSAQVMNVINTIAFMINGQISECLESSCCISCDLVPECPPDVFPEDMFLLRTSIPFMESHQVWQLLQVLLAMRLQCCLDRDHVQELF